MGGGDGRRHCLDIACLSMTKRAGRKRRPRHHVIADLGVAHIERQVLSCGFSVERVEKDYGVDLILFTYDSNGRIENGQVYIQVKATERARQLKRTPAISFHLERAHLEFWLFEPMPVILALYDVTADEAYWLYLQGHFEGNNLAIKGTKTQVVRIDTNNLVDEQSVRLWARYKADVLAQIAGVIKHNA
jgi:hypothetical protein